MSGEATLSLSLGLPIPITPGQVDLTSGFAQRESSQRLLNTAGIRPAPQKSQRPGLTSVRGAELIEYAGDSHLMTIAPTGAGKGRSVIIPNLLTYPGPIIVVDPKGENYAVTARRRREMGQRVIRLDPFGVIDGNSDGLNPMDIFDLLNMDIETDSQMLAEMLSIGNRGVKDPFWDLNACGLISGLMAHVALTKAQPERNFSALRQFLMADDVVYKLAVLLDTQGKTMNRMAYEEIASFLQMSERDTRPGVLATAHSYMKAFLSKAVDKALEKSSFTLADVVAGEPLSIYIIIPPDKLLSHRALLKLWVGTLLKAVTSRKTIPQQRTLFLLDECGQLGNFPYLESVITLCRGYGLQVWSFWQDMSQIKKLYEMSWSTMVNNCAVLQIFGAKNYVVANEFAQLVGADANEIRGVGSDEQVLVINGEDPIRAYRLDYLTDARYKGMYDVNPLYAGNAPRGL